MRDINRIDPFMEKLTKLWKEQCPDWRFSQLISNIMSYIGCDPFYMEDDEMMKCIENFFNKPGKEKP